MLLAESTIHSLQGIDANFEFTSESPSRESQMKSFNESYGLNVDSRLVTSAIVDAISDSTVGGAPSPRKGHSADFYRNVNSLVDATSDSTVRGVRLPRKRGSVDFYRLNRSISVHCGAMEEYEPIILAEIFFGKNFASAYYEFLLKWRNPLASLTALSFLCGSILMNQAAEGIAWMLILSFAFAIFLLYAFLMHISIVKILFCQFDIQYLMLVNLAFDITHFAILMKAYNQYPVVIAIHVTLMSLYFSALFLIDAFPCLIFTPRFKSCMFIVMALICFMSVVTFTVYEQPPMTVHFMYQDWDFNQIRVSCMFTVALFKSKIVFTSIVHPDSFLVLQKPVKIMRESEG